jgi:3-(3-hydroxy-phenyl)propionate hydroxylase
MNHNLADEKNVSVVIVGAGPVGLTIANLLGLYGVSTLLVERNEQAYPYPRAISIDDEGLRICQALGLRSEVLEHVLLDMDALYLSHERPLVRVHPIDQRNGYPWISTFDQPRLEGVLLDGLQRFPSVSVRFGCTLQTFSQTQHGVSVQVQTTSGELFHVECDYLLACDGGKSGVRQRLNIAMRGSTFPQRWLVVDHINVDISTDPTHCITFFCDIERPTVQVFAPHGARRWEFMLLPGESDEHMLKEETIRNLIQRVASIPSEKSLRQAVYTFHASHADTFARARVFLVGDAAHLLPPFGGQGMNCGLRDAHNLAWKLALVVRGQAAQSLLTTYQTERKPHALQMIRFSAFAGSVVMPNNRFVALLRDIGLKIVMSIPFIRPLLVEMRIKPVSRYQKGFIYRSRDRSCRRLAGLLLPQPQVTMENGETLPLDDTLGHDFTLLRLYDDASQAFQPLQREFWQARGVKLLCVTPVVSLRADDQPASSHNKYVVDAEHVLQHLIHGRQDILLLVRPDRYIAAAFPIDEEKSAMDWFQTYVQAATEREVTNAG